MSGGLPGTASESLQYTCNKCGYTHSEPCKDKNESSGDSKDLLLGSKVPGGNSLLG
jgi:hypothetical protein